MPILSLICAPMVACLFGLAIWFGYPFFLFLALLASIAFRLLVREELVAMMWWRFDQLGDGWYPVELCPPRKWVETKREGEDGGNLCGWVPADRYGDEREWISYDGRTTVTHHSFAPPTHFRKLVPTR